MDIPPVVFGPRGTARQMPKFECEKPDEAATVSQWFIYAPGQSPAWSHYLLSICHLRDMDGVKPAEVVVEGATHELTLFALDSDQKPKFNDRNSLSALTPANAACQFIVDSDEQASELAFCMARAICLGDIPAEPMFQQAGQDQWQGVVSTTAEHIRTGGHEAPEDTEHDHGHHNHSRSTPYGVTLDPLRRN
jgi:hypothetical protein